MSGRKARLICKSGSDRRVLTNCGECVLGCDSHGQHLLRVEIQPSSTGLYSEKGLSQDAVVSFYHSSVGADALLL
eukprot:12893853-Prorocentrum_lima.AAC.1